MSSSNKNRTPKRRLGKLPERNDMPIQNLDVNGTSIKIKRYVANSLTEEACRNRGLVGVDIDIVHTDLDALNSKIVTTSTYGLIFYKSAKLNLPSEPVYVSTGVRLMTHADNGTDVEAITFARGEYEVLPFLATTPGSMGCTAAWNLGFSLLERFEGSTTKELDMLILLDRLKLRGRLEKNIPIVDEPIYQFIREISSGSHSASGSSVVPGDCNEYPECQHQLGTACDFEWGMCR